VLTVLIIKMFDIFFLYFLSQILHFTHIFERNKTSWKSGFSPIYKHLVHFSWFKKKSTTRIVVWSHYIMHKKLIWDPDKLYIFSDKILAGA
jgi:hypothetical protein